MTPKPPTSRQLSYLRALAQRTGRTFVSPRTSGQASREIRRLSAVKASTDIELYLERVDVATEQAAREANCDVPINIREVQGYGSSATWSRRS